MLRLARRILATIALVAFLAACTPSGGGAAPAAPGAPSVQPAAASDQPATKPGY